MAACCKLPGARKVRQVRDESQVKCTKEWRGTVAKWRAMCWPSSVSALTCLLSFQEKPMNLDKTIRNPSIFFMLAVKKKKKMLRSHQIVFASDHI